ncbi:Helix-hairpin-helix motif protein [compost metagenome]
MDTPAKPLENLSALDHMPGAEVVSPDGIAGQLDMLGVRPHSDEITHLVVRRGFLFQRDVLVPIDWVDQVSPETNQIHLKARVSQVDAMPEYRRGPDLVGMAWNLATLPLRLPLQLAFQRWQNGRLETQERMIRAARRQRAQDDLRMREMDPTAFDKAARRGAHLINLNTAGKEELEEINGIGPSLAQAIIDRRPIESLDALIHQLQELSPQTAERLRKVTTL